MPCIVGKSPHVFLEMWSPREKSQFSVQPKKKNNLSKLKILISLRNINQMRFINYYNIVNKKALKKQVKLD